MGGTKYDRSRSSAPTSYDRPRPKATEGYTTRRVNLDGPMSEPRYGHYTVCEKGELYVTSPNAETLRRIARYEASSDDGFDSSAYSYAELEQNIQQEPRNNSGPAGTPLLINLNSAPAAVPTVDITDTLEMFKQADGSFLNTAPASVVAFSSTVTGLVQRPSPLDEALREQLDKLMLGSQKPNFN